MDTGAQTTTQSRRPHEHREARLPRIAHIRRACPWPHFSRPFIALRARTVRSGERIVQGQKSSGRESRPAWNRPRIRHARTGDEASGHPRIPDLPDSIGGFDDLDFDRAAQEGTTTSKSCGAQADGVTVYSAEIEQFASVETFDTGRSSEVDRESTDRIPHIADERPQIVPAGNTCCCGGVGSIGMALHPQRQLITFEPARESLLRK